MRPEESNAYRARIVALGMTQNELGRRIGKDQGLLGRWLRGEISSEPIRKLVDKRLAMEERRVVRSNGRR